MIPIIMNCIYEQNNCISFWEMLVTVQYRILLSSHLLSKNVKIEIYKTTILQATSYGSGIWSLTLREEYRFRSFENRVLRIFRSKKDEVTGGWRKVHNEKVHSLYSWANIRIMEDQMGKACRTHER
jgi:hypothetical protein